MPEVKAPHHPPPLTPEERRIYIEALEGEGLTVSQKPQVEQVRTRILSGLAKPGQTVKLGIVSDTHLGSQYQQITALRDFYRRCDAESVDAFIHGGDLTDGSYRMHRDHVLYNFIHGLPAQLKYAIEEYPKSKRAGVKTHVVMGNHDYSFSSDGGGNVVELLAQQREDIVYVGYHSAFIDVGGVRIFVVHGARGGLSYAKSYKPQKLAEALDVEQRAKTHLMLIGHYHTGNFIPRYQGLDIFLLPAFQSQTPFLRTLGLQPVIGGVILEIELGKGYRMTRHEWVTYDPVEGDFPGARR